MTSVTATRVPLLATLTLLIVNSVAAHGHEDHTIQPAVSLPTGTQSGNQTYHQRVEDSTWIYSHILIMSIAWIFLLPVAVMLSISRSRYDRLAQFTFLGLNGIGLGTGLIYNRKAPDLYPNNAHHRLGWVVTFILLVQLVIGMIAQARKPEHAPDHESVPREDDDRNQYKHTRFLRTVSSRFSQDSGHGTISSPGSRSTSYSEESRNPLDFQELPSHFDCSPERRSKWTWFASIKQARLGSARLQVLFRFLYDTVDRTILLVGFTSLATGWVTYGGLFKDGAVFSGLAHFIKGGVFFWLGVLSLGRWAGAYQDIGWAWNLKPPNIGDRVPSVEFVESFLIFFYGSTNIFLEHLSAWGAEWTAVDLEHISLTVMFIGGGMIGMLVESRLLRDLLINKSDADSMRTQFTIDKITEHEPAFDRFSINPVPALVIILLGKMMSSHHQESMVSTMIHGQWGNLLVGAGVARLGSYILVFLSPPISTSPGRLPTELLASFGLMAGGLIFMASARDVVENIELYNLDAMFVFTVTTGVVMLLMAWIIIVLAIKAWAMKRENRDLSYKALPAEEHDEV